MPLPAAAAQSPDVSVECRSWVRYIDPTLGEGPIVIQLPIPEQEKLLAMQCFLRSEGNQNPARAKITMSFNGGRNLPQPTVEIAALYYISYLYEEDFEHALGIAFWDVQGCINPPGSVHLAYRLYEEWFAKVKGLGLEEARKQKLKPLATAKVKWYGQ